MIKKHILLVDDEKPILRVLEHVMQTSLDCETQTATSGTEALKLMEQKSFDLIVSDIKMPGMDGADLLSIVQELYPQTIRLVLTASLQGNIGLRTATSTHQFFLKPLDISVLGDKIQNVLRLRKILPEEGIEKIVSQIKSLPSLPDTYIELENELRKKDASIATVSKILEKDVAMSAKILHLVNSAFFGLREHVAQPSQAAVLLGVDVIKSLTLAIHVFTGWENKDESGLSLKKLWNHSLNVAAYSKKIASIEHTTQSVKDDAYIAGLFHDIGKLILADNLTESYDCIQKLMRKKNISLIDAEQEVLGATHAEIGAYLLALWGFTDEVVNAVAFHHCPRRADISEFNALTAVHVANVFEYDINQQDDFNSSKIDATYIEAQNLSDRLSDWKDTIIASTKNI